jgi:hypothetical protein
MAIGTKKLEDYVPVVKFNEGLYTALPVSIAGDLTVTGTTNIGDISLDDLTTTGNTTLGNAVGDVLAIGGTAINIPASAVLASAGTGATGFKLKNLKNAAASALSGTQLDVEIDIGGVPTTSLFTQPKHNY